MTFEQQTVARMLGAEVAEKVGPVWGFDEHGFMRGMWTRLPQDGLWLMGGSLIECRTHSRYLALSIKAQIEGLLPDTPLV